MYINLAAHKRQMLTDLQPLMQVWLGSYHLYNLSMRKVYITRSICNVWGLWSCVRLGLGMVRVTGATILLEIVEFLWGFFNDICGSLRNDQHWLFTGFEQMCAHSAYTCSNAVSYLSICLRTWTISFCKQNIESNSFALTRTHSILYSDIYKVKNSTLHKKRNGEKDCQSFPNYRCMLDSRIGRCLIRSTKFLAWMI